MTATTTPAAAPALCLYTVKKVCVDCGDPFEGPSFVPHAADADRLPGKCGPCLAEDEANYQRVIQAHHYRMPPAPPDPPPLVRPVRTDAEPAPTWTDRLP